MKTAVVHDADERGLVLELSDGTMVLVECDSVDVDKKVFFNAVTRSEELSVSRLDPHGFMMQVMFTVKVGLCEDTESTE